MTEFDNFLLWEEKSRDTIDFKKVYVDIANDLIAGLLLSQIVYWYLPDKYGETKLRVEKNGYLWIAKGRDDWHAEIRISAKQFDRASGILVKKGILVKDYFMFDGFRTVHIRLDYDRFMQLWQEQLESGYVQQRVRPVLPKGEDRSRLKVKTGIDQRVRPITENTDIDYSKDIPLEKKSSGPSLKTQTSEPAIVSDLCTKSPDQEVTLDDVFGPNGRQPEIDAWQTEGRRPISTDALLLGAMAGPISPAVRSKLAQMRDQGWQVKDSEIELLLAQFFEVTQFVIPTNKGRRKFFESSVREHIQEEVFSGRVGELYETVWSNIAADVRAGDLEITSPKSFTSFMYGVLNREDAPVSELTRAELIDLLKDDGLVEVREINDAFGFVWIETGELVGDDIPADIVARYSRAGSDS